MSSSGKTLAELLAAAEKRKYDAVRKRLGLSDSSRIAGVELDSLAYHLTERTGQVRVKLDGDVVRVGDADGSGNLVYRGEAAQFLLAAWSLDRAEIADGVTIEVREGKRVDVA